MYTDVIQVEVDGETVRYEVGIDTETGLDFDPNTGVLRTREDTIDTVREVYRVGRHALRDDLERTNAWMRRSQEGSSSISLKSLGKKASRGSETVPGQCVPAQRGAGFQNKSLEELCEIGNHALQLGNASYAAEIYSTGIAREEAFTRSSAPTSNEDNTATGEQVGTHQGSNLLYARLHANRAEAYLRLGRLEEVVHDTKWALRLNPNLYKAYYRKGVALFRMNRYEEAHAELVQCREHLERQKDPRESVALLHEVQDMINRVHSSIQELPVSWDDVQGRPELRLAGEISDRCVRKCAGEVILTEPVLVWWKEHLGPGNAMEGCTVAHPSMDPSMAAVQSTMSIVRSSFRALVRRIMYHTPTDVISALEKFPEAKMNLASSVTQILYETVHEELENHVHKYDQTPTTWTWCQLMQLVVTCYSNAHVLPPPADTEPSGTMYFCILKGAKGMWIHPSCFPNVIPCWGRPSEVMSKRTVIHRVDHTRFSDHEDDNNHSDKNDDDTHGSQARESVPVVRFLAIQDLHSGETLCTPWGVGAPWSCLIIHGTPEWKKERTWYYPDRMSSSWLASRSLFTSCPLKSVDTDVCRCAGCRSCHPSTSNTSRCPFCGKDAIRAVHVVNDAYRVRCMHSEDAWSTGQGPSHACHNCGCTLARSEVGDLSLETTFPDRLQLLLFSHTFHSVYTLMQQRVEERSDWRSWYMEHHTHLYQLHRKVSQRLGRLHWLYAVTCESLACFFLLFHQVSMKQCPSEHYPKALRVCTRRLWAHFFCEHHTSLTDCHRTEPDGRTDNRTLPIPFILAMTWVPLYYTTNGTTDDNETEKNESLWKISDVRTLMLQHAVLLEKFSIALNDVVGLGLFYPLHTYSGQALLSFNQDTEICAEQKNDAGSEKLASEKDSVLGPVKQETLDDIIATWVHYNRSYW